MIKNLKNFKYRIIYMYKFILQLKEKVSRDKKITLMTQFNFIYI